MRSLVFLFALVAAAYAQDEYQFVCPESYGDFTDEEYCDYFWRCNNGEPELMECLDGHSFDPSLRGAIYPCDYTIRVNCTGRELLRDPEPTQDAVCERKYGIYPDPDLCDLFYICQDGISTKQRCSSNNHYKVATGECVWPELSGRTNCLDTESLNGFICPPGARNAIDINGNRNINPLYADPADCRYFYVCESGKTPRQGGCSDGLVFNNITKICDDPINVPDCISYYGESFDGEDSFVE